MCGLSQFLTGRPLCETVGSWIEPTIFWRIGPASRNWKFYSISRWLRTKIFLSVRTSVLHEKSFIKRHLKLKETLRKKWRDIEHKHVTSYMKNLGKLKEALQPLGKLCWIFVCTLVFTNLNRRRIRLSPTLTQKSLRVTALKFQIHHQLFEDLVWLFESHVLQRSFVIFSSSPSLLELSLETPGTDPTSAGDTRQARLIVRVSRGFCKSVKFLLIFICNRVIYK